jgi:tRNA(adenine34) deaminase
MGESFSEADTHWMRRALELAARAEREGEVPVGAVLVRADEVLGEGWNRPITLHDPSAHAEILAMREAGARAANYRLPESTLYVTLEPCAMCVGAMIHARIARIVFAASDPKTGALGGAFDLPGVHAHNHVIRVQGGLLAAEAGELLRAFFRKRR